MAEIETTTPPDVEELYDLCKDAEKLLEKVATGLGQVGAAPEAVEAVSKMADVVGKICNGLAKGMKEAPAEPAHTMDSAADEMMAERRASAGPPA
jgi:hypothetical protein